MLSSPKLVGVTVAITPKGSESLFGPNNHSIEGILLGRRLLGVIVTPIAKHLREASSPTALEPEFEMVTTPSMFTEGERESIIV